jgi:hypothetical protein
MMLGPEMAALIAEQRRQDLQRRADGARLAALARTTGHGIRDQRGARPAWAARKLRSFAPAGWANAQPIRRSRAGRPRTVRGLHTKEAPMSITSTRGWHAAARHKIVSMAVILVAAAVLTVTMVLTPAADPAGGGTPNSGTSSVAPQTHANLPGCERGRVVSYC